MSSLIRFLQLRFLPHSQDFGLLVLRIWVGGSLLFLHGVAKLTNFTATAAKFPNVFAPYLDVSPSVNLALAIGAEVGGAALVIVGLFSRLSALACGFTMAMGFFVAHKGVLSGDASGEIAFIYMAAFLTIFLAGPGRFSLDAVIGRGNGVR